MEFGTTYPEASAFGIKDVLNEMKKKRLKREAEMKQRFPMKDDIRGLNAMGGVPVNQSPGPGSPLGSVLPSAGGVQYQGRDIYQSINRLQRRQMGNIYDMTPKSQSFITGFKTGKGRRVQRGGGGKSRGRRRNYGGGPKGQVRSVASKYGWDKGKEWNALVRLVHKESSWRPGAANPTSSARGLFQKMTSIHGPVERNAKGQAKWGLKYIKGRYGSPSKALAFHLRNNWY